MILKALASSGSVDSLKIDAGAVGVVGFGTMVNTILTGIYVIAGALAVLYLIYAGIQYITAGGDSAKATSARTGIVNTVVGIIVIMLAFSITNWAQGLVGGELGDGVTTGGTIGGGTGGNGTGGQTGGGTTPPGPGGNTGGGQAPGGNPQPQPNPVPNGGSGGSNQNQTPNSGESDGTGGQAPGGQPTPQQDQVYDPRVI